MQQDVLRSVRCVPGALFCLTLMFVGLSGCGGGSNNSAVRMASTGPLAVGSWGGSLNESDSLVTPATLTSTATGFQMAVACQRQAQSSQAVVLDGNGHFAVTGTSSPCCTGIFIPTRFEGTVANGVMTVTLTNTNTGVSLGTYTLRFGQLPPSQNFGCPG
jgi:hypothetical protein